MATHIERAQVVRARTIDEALNLLRRNVADGRLARSYDDFYQGEPAPLSDATVALWGASP